MRDFLEKAVRPIWADLIYFRCSSEVSSGKTLFGRLRGFSHLLVGWLLYFYDMEDKLLFKIGDNFFFAFHIALIIFNLFGWIPKKLRKWNLVSLSLTAFSWFVLGIFYGFGYCFLTEWHWQIRESLGYLNQSNSYIHFLLVEIFGISIGERVVDIFTGIFFFAAVVASVYVNFKGKKSRF